MMGGGVRVKSQYSKGSVFTVTIKQKTEEGPSLCTIKDPSKANSLILEPRELQAKSVAWTLNNLGATKVEITSDSAQAEALLEKGQFNFIFGPISLSETILELKEKSENKSLIAALYAPLDDRTREIKGAVVLHSPLFCLSVANVLNDSKAAGPIRNRVGRASFTAPGAKVLIVDDLEINLKVAKGLMSPFKLQVDLCLSGTEAIEMAAENTYDLIFMDHMMPGMDGLEATEEIRRLPKGKTVPIVALTANAVFGVKEMFLSRGMNDFISKPIEIAKLEVVLAKWIPKDKRVENQPD
jgi:CheY-like chemotaxis protein